MPNLCLPNSRVRRVSIVHKYAYPDNERLPLRTRRGLDKSTGHKSCMEGVFDPPNLHRKMAFSFHIFKGIDQCILALSVKNPKYDELFGIVT